MNTRTRLAVKRLTANSLRWRRGALFTSYVLCPPPRKLRPWPAYPGSSPTASGGSGFQKGPPPMSNIDDIITHLEDALFYLDHANTVDEGPYPISEAPSGPPVYRHVRSIYLQAASDSLVEAIAAVERALAPTSLETLETT